MSTRVTVRRMEAALNTLADLTTEDHDELDGQVTRPLPTSATVSASLCPYCGHIPREGYGCAGRPTPSDLWAGVYPGDCDCECEPPAPTQSHVGAK